MSISSEVESKVAEALRASYKMMLLSADARNKALRAMADALEDNINFISSENKKDLDAATEKDYGKAFIDRLTLNEKRVKKMAACLREVAELPDPVGEVVESWTLPNGLEIKRVRVPLGVVGLIYESRPDVTSDAAGICLKSGNCIVLRGGSEAINSSKAVAKVISEAAYKAGVPEGAIQLIESTDREAVKVMLRQRKYIDVIIPRGGGGLISFVVENSSVPVIETGEGNCHAYVDSEADLGKASDIVYNAKCQRPGVCNAIETLLVHAKVAPEFLPEVAKRLEEAGVELRGCSKTREILPDIKEASEEDWGKEYLDLVLAVKVVEDLNEAINHINKYSTKHSETIVTGDQSNAGEFTRRVDSAAVYVNASTRFTDGNQFGLGAEIGISTQKLHARGPMSVHELTSTKFVIKGDGQIRE